MFSRVAHAIWNLLGLAVTTRAIELLLASLVVARAFAPLQPLRWVWGLDVIRFLGPLLGWGLWLVLALSLLPEVARRVRLEALGDALVESAWSPALAGLFMFLLVLALPDRVWFVGDFLMRQGNVEANFAAGNYVAGMPLDWFLHSVVLRAIGGGSQESANLALRTLGAVEAFVLGVLGVWLARALETRGATAVAVTAIALFGGTLTMFTGLGKPASELCLLVLGLTIAAVRARRGRESLLPLGLTMGFALMLHRSSVALIPAWALIVRQWWREKKPEQRRSWKNRSGLLAPLLAAVISLPRIVTLLLQYDLAHHLAPDAVRRQGVLAAAFAGPHLAALLNLLLALSPLFLLGVLLLVLRPARLREHAVMPLAVLAGTFLPLMLFVHPQQGLFRDWDVFAPAAMSITVLTAVLVPAAIARPRWLALPIALSAMIPSLQWLILNSQEQVGLARVRTYLIQTSEPGAPQAWDFLAARYMRLQRWPEAADAAAHAAELAPHRRILLTWALAETMKPDDRAAQGVYLRLLRQDRRDPLAWIGVAGTATRLRDSLAAREALDSVRSLSADPAKAAEIRRHLEHFPQVWTDSLP
jgi:hypothetical protein